MADTTTNATAAPAAHSTSGAGASAPASNNNRSGSGDGFWTPRNIMVAVLGLPMALFALMGVINALVNATATASSAFGFVGGLIAIGVILIILSALGARLMSDEHSKRLMWVGIAVAGFGAIVWLLSLGIVKSLFSITVTGTGVQTPLLDQPWWALVLMAVGVIAVVGGLVWALSEQTKDEAITAKIRRLTLLAITVAALSFAVSLLLHVDWEQVKAIELPVTITEDGEIISVPTAFDTMSAWLWEKRVQLIGLAVMYVLSMLAFPSWPSGWP